MEFLAQLDLLDFRGAGTGNAGVVGSGVDRWTWRVAEEERAVKPEY